MIDLRKIPFTYPWILDQAVRNDCKTVLDVGCGDGSTMEKIAKGKNWKITGIDVHSPSLVLAKNKKIYTNLEKVNLVKFPKKISSKKYDLVFCSQVVEHLSKKEALKLIKECEKVAKKRVIISTTVGFMKFHPLEYSEEDKNNPFQEHLSGWSTQEFEEKGYSVRGQGLSLIYGENMLAHKLPKALRPFLYLISIIFSPIVYFFPNLATYQINHKKM